MSITIDEEFRSLIPPLTADEYTQLEKNILKDGIRDPLVVWKTPSGNEILVDGHNRKRIADAHPGITYKVEYMKFDLRKDAIQWIILNQFGRRNLSAYDRSILALKLKPVIAKEGKAKQSEAGGAVRQKSEKAAVNTTKQLAKVAGVSHDTIHKVEVIEANDNDRLKQQVRSGEKSINQGYKEIMASKIREAKPDKKKPLRDAKERHEDFQERKQESAVNISDIRQDKADRKIIADDFLNRINNAMMAVFGIGMPDKKDAEINDIFDVMDDFSIQQLKNNILLAMQSLSRLQEIVNRR